MSWIFAYGSLMWDDQPGFRYDERREGVLQDYERDFNKKSVVNWGSSANPGPVLGLEEGSECEGVAFRLPEGDEESVLDALSDREGPSYRLEEVQIEIEDTTQEGYVFVNKRNKTYIGDLTLKERARMSLEAEGDKGSAEEYARQTYEKINQLEFQDPAIKQYIDVMNNLSK